MTAQCRFVTNGRFIAAALAAMLVLSNGCENRRPQAEITLQRAPSIEPQSNDIKTGAETSRIRIAGHPVSFVPPTDWTRFDGPEPSRVTFADSAGELFRANVTVVAETCNGILPLDALKVDRNQLPPNVELLNSEIRSIGGRDAMMTRVRKNDPGSVPVINIQCFLPANGTVYSISFMAAEADVTRFEPIFQSMLDSVRDDAE